MAVVAIGMVVSRTAAATAAIVLSSSPGCICAGGICYGLIRSDHIKRSGRSVVRAIDVYDKEPVRDAARD